MDNRQLLIFTLVVLCANVVFCASRTNDLKQNCSLVRPFLEMRNITVTTEEDATHGEICGGSCCNPSMEANLRLQVQKDFSSLLRHNSRSLQGLLDTTASTLQDHVLSLTRQSENKTLVLFSQVYRSMAVFSQEPIKALYQDIRQSISIISNQQQDINSFTPSPVDIKSSVYKLFTDLFPLVYHHNINTQHTARDFTASYKVCLRETIHEVQPFGDVPRQTAQTLSKCLEATRLLLQAFHVGGEVLNATETLLTNEGNEHECLKALVRMSYCPTCLGHRRPGASVKPCAGYCLNVLHGCITRHVADLDSAWNNYVQAMERLVTAWKQQNNEAGINVHFIIKGLDTKISEAIMYAMENTPELEKKVKKACGLPKLSEKEDLSLTTLPPAAAKLSKPQRMTSIRDTPPPDTQLIHFIASVTKSRNFFTSLADSLCKDDSFADQTDQACWNGKRIGEYTDTVVDPSLGMHKYNPEVNFTSTTNNADVKIANLADKLRHVYNTVTTALGPVNLPQAESHLREMMGDDPDGSGSGHGETDDDSDVPGSGSGGGEDPTGTRYPPDMEEPSRTGGDKDRPHSSAAATATSVSLLLLLQHLRLLLVV